MNSITEIPSPRVNWQQHLDIWKKSDLSAPKYCQANNLVYHCFAYWRKKLAALEGAEPHSPSLSSGFIQVAYPATQIDSLQLTLPNGMSIEGISEGNINLGRQLLDVL